MTTPPLKPNFDPTNNPGRLVTDRYDFEAHIEGQKFRHTAPQIDLSPAIAFDGYGFKTTVQDALAALSLLVGVPTILDATTSVKGIVQLTGDIGGTATNVSVIKIQGKPINTLAPSPNDVLTWNGSSWSPAGPANVFSAGGDLSGTNVLQHVVGLTGSAGTVSVFCNIIDFVMGATPQIIQDVNTGAGGTNFSLIAQGSSFATGKGGDVVISGGAPGAGGLKGGVKLQVNGSNLVQAAQVVTGQRVLSLVDSSNLTSGDMPANTGDMVIYIRDAATAPSSGNPVSGSILFSDNGGLFGTPGLCVRQSDGNQFLVGSIPNPSIWGPTGQQTVTYRDFNQSAPATPINIHSFSLQDNAATRFDVILIGKDILMNDSAQFNLSIGYTSNVTVPADVGTLTSSDPRATAGALVWTLPTINRAGSTITVISGAGPNPINWFVVTQLAVVTGP